VRVTRLRRRSPDFVAQWSRQLAAPGLLASARAGEQAAAAPSRPLRPATMASGRRRCVAWREKGEGKDGNG